MSCSYGPGRYDLNYEEKGIDYPFGYVRWTENRNMQAFQELAYKGKIAVDSLTTHVFSLDDAPQAYDMILKRAEYFLGVLLKYDITGCRYVLHIHLPLFAQLCRRIVASQMPGFFLCGFYFLPMVNCKIKLDT